MHPNWRVLIIGGGDLGLLLAHHIKSISGWEFAGFVDDFNPKGATTAGPVLGGTNDVRALAADGVCNAFLVAVGYRHFRARQELFERFIDVLPSPAMIHPTAHVDETAKVGAGSVIFPRAIVDAGSVIDENVLLNTAATVCHHSRVGAHSFVAPAACIAGFCRVGRRCFVGINSTLRDNIHVVDDATIGAGAVVARNITNSGIYVGVPARRFEASGMGASEDS